MFKNNIKCLFFHIYLLSYSNFFNHATKLKLKTERLGHNCPKNLNALMLNLPELFGTGLLLHLVMSNNDFPVCLSSDLLKELSMSYQIVLTSLEPDEPTQDILFGRPDVYVLFIKNFYTVSQIQKTISRLMNYSQSWNPRAKFLLIVSTPNYPQHTMFELVKDTFNFLWKINVFKAALVVFEGKRDEIRVFSSLPYSSIYGTCREITDPSQLQEVTLTDTQLNEVNIVGYNYQTPKQFNGCPFIAYTFPLPPYTVVDDSKNDKAVNLKYKMGMEIELIYVFAAKYNFSLHLNTAEYYFDNNGWSYKLENGTAVGMIEDLKNYKIDLAFAGALSPSGNYYLLEHCYTLMINSISWYVPGSEVLPSWRLITNAFQIGSWLLLTTAFLSFPLLFEVMSTLTSALLSPEPVYLMMWRTLLGVPSPWTPSPSHLRILMFSWSLFSLHIAIMVTTRLLSLLAERPIKAGVRTIEELQKSSLKTCMPENYKEYYTNKTESYTKLIVDAAIICNNVEQVLQQFLDNRNLSILTKDDYMTYLIDLNKVNVHSLEQKFITYPVTMLVTKGSFIKETIDKLLVNVFNAGMFQKWLHDVIEDSNSSYTPTPKNQEKKNLVLHLEDFTWLFILLLIGYSTALLIFCLEIFVFHFKLKSNNMRKGK